MTRQKLANGGRALHIIISEQAARDLAAIQDRKNQSITAIIETLLRRAAARIEK